MSPEIVTEAIGEFALDKLKELGLFADLAEKVEVFDTPTIELISAEASAGNEAVKPEAAETKSREIPMSDGNADTCNVFDDVEAVTTVLGIDCEAGAIEGFKDLAEKLVTDEAAANIRPGHPLYELVQAQLEGDMEAVNQEAARLAQAFDFWQPEQTAESALLQPGTQFVLEDSGVLTVVAPNGDVLAMSDCDGIVIQYDGPMIDSGDCDTCIPEVTQEPTIAEAAAPAEAPNGVQAQMVEMCVAPGVCEMFGPVYIFDSIEEAQAFAENPPLNAEGDSVLDDYQQQLQSRYRFFVVADPNEEYVQCLPFDVRGDEVQLKTNRMFPLEFRDEGRLVGHMSYGVSEKYFNGYVGTEGVRSVSGLEFDMAAGETPFPTAPVEYIYDATEGRYVLEPFDTSVERTFLMWVSEMGISVEDWYKINDMPLPEAFADPSATVEERAHALKAAIDERIAPRTITLENATELTRILNEGAFGQDGGLGNWNEQALVVENNLAVSARDGSGQMARLDSAMLTASQNATAVMRAALT